MGRGGSAPITPPTHVFVMRRPNALKQNGVTPTVTINTSNDLVKDAQVATKRGREGDQSEYPETPYNIDLNVLLNWIRAKHSMNESDKQLQN